MKKLIKLCLYLIIVMALIVPNYISFTTTAATVSSDKFIKIGAIRWDSWIPPDVNTDAVGAPFMGAQVAKSLNPEKYHFRLPFSVTFNSNGDVQFPPYTQEIIDQEFKYAMNAGIDYWAYCFYATGSGMDTARKLHETSQYKNDVKMCFVIGSLQIRDINELLVLMKQELYMKVLGGHPLIYLYGSNKGVVDSIKKKCITAGIPAPYFVAMGSAIEADQGEDAVSNYAIFVGDGADYSDLALETILSWSKQKSWGRQVVPLVSTGWDPRPRIDNPLSNVSYPATSWTKTGTPSEVASLFGQAINWIIENPESTYANCIISYAWNENDEGGWLCPTVKIGTDGKIIYENGKPVPDTSRLDALKTVIDEYHAKVLAENSNSSTPLISHSKSISISNRYSSNISSSIINSSEVSSEITKTITSLESISSSMDITDDSSIVTVPPVVIKNNSAMIIFIVISALVVFATSGFFLIKYFKNNKTTNKNEIENAKNE